MNMEMNNLVPTKHIAPIESNSLAGYAANLESKLKICDLLLKSRMLPGSLTSAQAVLAIVLKGQEYGFAPMTSCELFDFIQGRCAMRVAGMTALCKQEGGTFDVVEETADKCTIIAKRPSKKWEQKYTFKMSQAAAMGLSNKDNWKKMPEFMLYARCISVLCRRGWADILAGLYSSEEMSDGADVIDVSPQQSAPKGAGKTVEVLQAEEVKPTTARRYDISQMPEDKRENAITYLTQSQAVRIDENLFESQTQLVKLSKYEVTNESN